MLQFHPTASHNSTLITSICMIPIQHQEERVYMEEEEGKGYEVMDPRYPRKLNYNAPLLSTRRISGFTGEEASCRSSKGVLQSASGRIPFSWEQAPGKPKNPERGDIGEAETPRPRLPPCLWHPSTDAENKEYPRPDDQALLKDLDDGCDGDVDDDNNDDAAFSAAMDVFSLSEAIDMVTKSEKVEELDGLKQKLAQSTGDESPNYIIRRFLPDAAALAESSALAFSQNLNMNLPKPCNYPEPSPKGCGLEFFFPWRLKHKLCNLRSPIRQESPNLKPPWRSKLKKHRSFANVFRNVDKRN